MPGAAVAAACFLCVFLAAYGAETPEGKPAVQSVRFKTDVTPPAMRLPRQLQPQEKYFRAGLKSMPEGALITAGLAAAGAGALGLSREQTASLTPLVANVYAEIYRDPAFAGLPSALPYCFSTRKPADGHYFLYQPVKPVKDPECIVFLHGFGGNFQLYMWVLKEEFPDAVIIAPSWGISWSRGSARYVEKALEDAERRTGLSLETPWLMGLSAGGTGGFKVYNLMPERFAGYICLASIPTKTSIRHLQKNMKILMLNGVDDAMMPVKVARERQKQIAAKVPVFRYEELDANHFFLLSHRQETFDIVRAFLEKEPAPEP